MPPDQLTSPSPAWTGSWARAPGRTGPAQGDLPGRLHQGAAAL